MSPRPAHTGHVGSRNRVGVASLVVSSVVALGSWQQIWKGIASLTETTFARWVFVVLIGVVLLAASVAFVVALFAVGREIRQRVDSGRRLRDELQAAAILHQEVLLVLASSVGDGSKVQEAVTRARENLMRRGISLDQSSGAHDLLKEFDRRLAVDDMENLRRALRQYREASRPAASKEAPQRGTSERRNYRTAGLHGEKQPHRSPWWKWL